MSIYFCKCGRLVRKSTNAENTGYRDTARCTGCPYLLPYGEQAYAKGEGFRLNIKGYECRMSRALEYASRFAGSVTDKCTCSVASLDYDFLTRVSAWICGTYSNGELSGTFSPKNIRPTDFSSNGRYRLPICCAQNKAGIAAKAALREHFFNPDGSRKGMAPEEEEKKIKDLIEKGKRAAQGTALEPEQAPVAPGENPAPVECLCESCTCTGCHEACFGHCQGCGNPTGDCNSYQAGGEKFLPEVPDTLDEAIDRPELPDEPASEKALAAAPDALPAFNYSGLDAETAMRLQNLARRALESKQRYYLDMMGIVYEAHLELVANRDKRTNQYSEATFRTWCASIGVSKDAAYRLLQVQALMDNSTPEEQEILEQAQPSLLYAAAKPSAPAEAVAAVKSGDITTHKQYQGLLEEIYAREAKISELLEQSEKDQQRLESAEAENRANSARLAGEQRRREAAEAAQHAAERMANDERHQKRIAEDNRDAVRMMLENAKKRSAAMETERDEARAELAALRARPIEVAVAEPDPEEIERLAAEKAEGIAARRTAELEAQMEALKQAEQAVPDRDAEGLKMQDYDTVLFAISAIQNAWKSANPSFLRLDNQCREQLRRNLRERLAEIEKAVGV